MSQALILEFDGVGREQYDAVSRELGVNPGTGEGNWPAGLISHAGGAKAGGWVVFEVWESQQAQERFMEDRLGPALAAGGIPGPPARAEWVELAGYSTPGG